MIAFERALWSFDQRAAERGMDPDMAPMQRPSSAAPCTAFGSRIASLFKPPPVPWAARRAPFLSENHRLIRLCPRLGARVTGHQGRDYVRRNPVRMCAAGSSSP